MKIQVKRIVTPVVRLIDKRPMVSFLVALGLLILSIIGANFIRRPDTTIKTKAAAKKVETYSVGKAPRVNFSAQVEKSGVVQIVAMSGGVVGKINVTEGTKVKRGKTLLSLSSNYNGANAMTVARQMAEKQNKMVEDTYQSQVDLINKQRELANQSESNSSKIREITNQSVSDTQNLINLNNEIIGSIDQTINTLSADPVTNASLILSSKQLKSQFSSANLQLNGSLKNAQYTASGDNPPAKLAQVQKDMTMVQLEIQQKSLDLNREISGLQLKLARISESMMYPSAPFEGMVERVLVKTGQLVGPGTPLVVISGSGKTQATAVVYVPKEISEKVPLTETATFEIGGKNVEVTPAYVTHEAIEGNLYGIVYRLPSENYVDLTDKEYITARLPIKYAQSGVTIPYLPLDAIYQTQTEAYVFINNNGVAQAKKVKLGVVTGSFVAINEGLANGDQVILSRTITGGEAVETQ